LGDCALVIGEKAQSPITNPQSPITTTIKNKKLNYKK